MVLNEIKYFNTATGTGEFLKDYSVSNHMSPDKNGKYRYYDTQQDDSQKYKVQEYAEVDMDKDGNKEIVLQMSSSDVLLLRNYQGDIYGYVFPFRGMKGIKKDGSFEGSSGAGYIDVGTLRFKGIDCYYNEICSYNGRA